MASSRLTRLYLHPPAFPLFSQFIVIPERHTEDRGQEKAHLQAGSGGVHRA